MESGEVEEDDGGSPVVLEEEGGGSGRERKMKGVCSSLLFCRQTKSP